MEDMYYTHKKISSPTTNDFSPPPLALSLEVKFDTFYDFLMLCLKWTRKSLLLEVKVSKGVTSPDLLVVGTTKSIAGFS